MQPVLKFNVRNQNISRLDTFLPVRYSRNYLYAEFDFKTCDWNEKTKTAIFSGTGLEPISVILGETDTCLVPWEVLECTEFTVTVHAGDLITVDSAKVKLYESGYRPGDVPEPTPDVYKQLINMLTDQVDGLTYTDNILSLMAGEKNIASVTITVGSGSGTDGREVELQNDGSYIQWRYKGEESWTNLIALEDIKGPAGQAGADGSPGQPGRDGTTPHIGEDGHWYIGDTDTGVVAEGKDGATGEKGEPGEKGETGANGADGYSPTASVSKSGTVTTITITDKNGTTTEEILDGKKGADGKGITSVTIKDDGHLQIDYDDGTNADVGKVVGKDGLDGASGVPIKQEMTDSDTDVELQPNIFYMFPEMQELSISFADLSSATDTTAVAEYHFLFQSGATATTLTLPDTVKLPSGFSVDANKVYEISILEGCLCYQSWEVS